MRRIVYHAQFKKDMKLAVKRGRDIALLQSVIAMLASLCINIGAAAWAQRLRKNFLPKARGFALDAGMAVPQYCWQRH